MNDTKTDEASVRYGTTNVDGLDIFSREAGNCKNPAVVLLHGFPTSLHIYRNILASDLADGSVDLVLFGNLYITNPDLQERFDLTAKLNDSDPSTFYGGNEKGCTDNPFLAQQPALESA